LSYLQAGNQKIKKLKIKKKKKKEKVMTFCFKVVGPHAFMFSLFFL
jgi:hypothetical protein